MLYKEDGNPAWDSDIGVNHYTEGNQEAPSVVSGTENLDQLQPWAVLWTTYTKTSNKGDIVGSVWDFTGDVIAEELTISPDDAFQTDAQNSRAMMLDNGDILFVWDGFSLSAESGHKDDIYGRLWNPIDPFGDFSEQQRLNAQIGGYQAKPFLAPMGDDSAVIVWEGGESQDGDGYGIFGRSYPLP